MNYEYDILSYRLQQHYHHFLRAFLKAQPRRLTYGLWHSDSEVREDGTEDTIEAVNAEPHDANIRGAICAERAALYRGSRGKIQGWEWWAKYVKQTKQNTVGWGVSLHDGGCGGYVSYIVVLAPHICAFFPPWFLRLDFGIPTL